MEKSKDYTGTVYGGLGRLLYDYCIQNEFAIPQQLTEIQNCERFAFSEWREILNQLQDITQHPTLGLDIASYIQPKHLGIIAYIAQASDTLGEALIRYHDFHRLVYDGSPLILEQRDHQLSIRWFELPTELSNQLTDEIAIAIVVQFLRLYIDVDLIQLDQVNFRFPAPKHIYRYEQFFKCKVQFKQQYSEMIFSDTFLALPIKAADPTLQQLLLNQAQSELKKLPNNTQLDERIQQTILLGLQRQQFKIEDIATHLNFSVRQLQRHFQSQHTTFQKRLQDIRQILAIQYLSDPHLSLQDIALLLSYSEQSAFQRAFKQWTGLTPQQWRDRKTSIETRK